MITEAESELTRVSNKNLLAHHNREEVENITGDLPSRGFKIENATFHMSY